MTPRAALSDLDRFEKVYPSAAAANTALQRSLAARLAGVPTPAVLGRSGPMQLSFARITAAAPPSLPGMIATLQKLKRMPPYGLTRFDPFLRIRPRLANAPPHLQALVTALQSQKQALDWPAGTVVHGDFHPGQTLQDTKGKVWILDLDDLALAPPEADLGNLAAWLATQTKGTLGEAARGAQATVLAVAPQADPALTQHFLQIALIRRALKLAERGQPWALEQLPLPG
ncbi:MAG: phosphotransferase family protein [Tabrizicola sp.]